MKTLQIDSLTNSALAAVAKEMAKNGIDIYGVDRSKTLRALLRGYIASVVADDRAKTMSSATDSRGERAA